MKKSELYEQYRAKIAELGPLWAQSHELVARKLHAATLDDLNRASVELRDLEALIDSEMKQLAVLTDRLISLFETDDPPQG